MRMKMELQQVVLQPIYSNGTTRIIVKLDGMAVLRILVFEVTYALAMACRAASATAPLMSTGGTGLTRCNLRNLHKVLPNGWGRLLLIFPVNTLAAFRNLSSSLQEGKNTMLPKNKHMSVNGVNE